MRTTTKSLKKALGLLNLFLDHKYEMNLTELANVSGLNVSTVYRMTADLVACGYLNKLGRGRYSLGTKFLDFSGFIKSNNRIRQASIPFIYKLGHQTQESVILAIWEGYSAIVTETFYSGQMLKVVPDEGTKIPLYSTSLGKIKLASMTPKELQRYLNGEFEKIERITPNTITDMDALKKCIITVKRDGIAFDYEETVIGINSVAAPIFDNGGKVAAAVSIIGPSVRLTHDVLIKNCGNLKSCANYISTALRYTVNDNNILNE